MQAARLSTAPCLVPQEPLGLAMMATAQLGLAIRADSGSTGACQAVCQVRLRLAGPLCCTAAAGTRLMVLEVQVAAAGL